MATSPTGRNHTAFCSFCRKSHGEVGPLVEGPGDVYICGECIDLCSTIIDQEKRRINSGNSTAREIPAPQVIQDKLDSYVVGQSPHRSHDPELLMRPQNRPLDQLRPLTFELGFTKAAAGSVLVRSGATTVLCTCTVEMSVPPFLVGKGKGWMTSEYAMLPGSTQGRKARDKAGKVDGRSIEIQRLIGRSLRAVTDLSKLGERTLWLDCDVLEADGGTRTAAINGAFVALCMALHKHAAEIGLPASVVTDSVAASSVGIVDGQERLDLEYVEDRDADVDMNLVMTGSGRFIEVQGSGEEATFTAEQLFQLVALGRAGIEEVTRLQKAALGAAWPF